MQIAPKQWKLRTSNLIRMFLGTVWTWPQKRLNFGGLNADSSKTVNSMDFKFDKHVSRGQFGQGPLKFFEQRRGQGHVTP